MEDDRSAPRRRRIVAAALVVLLALFGGALLTTPADVAAAPSDVTTADGPAARQPPHPAGLVGVVLCRVFHIGCPPPSTAPTTTPTTAPGPVTPVPADLPSGIYGTTTRHTCGGDIVGGCSPDVPHPGTVVVAGLGRFPTAADGTFAIALPPGTYAVGADLGSTTYLCPATSVTVTDGATPQHVDLRCAIVLPRTTR